LDQAATLKLVLTKSSNHWRSYDYCAVDVETTGLNLKADEVISVGAVAIIDGRFKGDKNFYQEISPTKSPSAASIVIHGLRSVDLELAQSDAAVIPQLIEYMYGKHLIAHASWVEKAFLSNRLKKFGHKYPNDVIDTAALARYLGLVDSQNGHEPSLEFLAKKLNLPVYTPHHSLGDAMTTAALFLALAAKIEVKMHKSTGEVLTLHKLVEFSKN
jgi:DNA polymerase-3 subunit epsilon